MNVAELFNELWIVSNIEVVVTLLPEVLSIADQSASYSLALVTSEHPREFLARFRSIEDGHDRASQRSRRREARNLRHTRSSADSKTRLLASDESSGRR